MTITTPNHTLSESPQIMLAECGCGGNRLSSFPSWLIAGTKPGHLPRLPKERMLPPISWKTMLRGREWMARRQPVTAA